MVVQGYSGVHGKLADPWRPCLLLELEVVNWCVTLSFEGKSR